MSANLDLYERIAAGDKQAFAELLMARVIPRFRQWVRRRSRGIQLQLADLEDLEQDLILRLLKWYAETASLPKTLTALKAFSMEVGKNLLVDRGRQEAARARVQTGSELHAMPATSCKLKAWKSRIAELRAISLAGVNASVVHAYGVFVDLVHREQRWPSTQALAARLRVSPSRASKLKAAIQSLLRAHLALD